MATYAPDESVPWYPEVWLSHVMYNWIPCVIYCLYIMSNVDCFLIQPQFSRSITSISSLARRNDLTPCHFAVLLSYKLVYKS